MNAPGHGSRDQMIERLEKRLRDGMVQVDFGAEMRDARTNDHRWYSVSELRIHGGRGFVNADGSRQPVKRGVCANAGANASVERHTKDPAAVIISASVSEPERLVALQQRKQQLQHRSNARIKGGDVHDTQMRAVSQSLRKTLQHYVSAADGAIAAAEQAALEAADYKHRRGIPEPSDVKTWAMLGAESKAHATRVEMNLVEHRTRDAAFALAARIERIDSQVGDGSTASAWAAVSTRASPIRT